MVDRKVSDMSERTGKKCSLCGEWDMIHHSRNECDSCDRKMREKNKSLLEI